AVLFFFFQAEDGIRDYKVTGVQTVLFRSEGAGDLERLRVVELGKHLGELVIDLGVTLLDEDGYVKRFLRRERGEVAFHFVAPRRSEERRVGEGVASRAAQCLVEEKQLELR